MTSMISKIKGLSSRLTRSYNRVIRVSVLRMQPFYNRDADCSNTKVPSKWLLDLKIESKNLWMRILFHIQLKFHEIF